MLFEQYPRRTYSQFGEDAILRSILPAGKGTYIDIGSGHPVAGSNTYALYEMGWQGVLVDPIAANIEMSERLRPRDLSIQAVCAGEQMEDIEFFEFDVYEYSTTSRDRVNELARMGHSVKRHYRVSTCTLGELVREMHFEGTTVLSIDVEGGEFEVLQGNDWTKFHPAIIIIEEWDPPLLRPTEISEYLRAHDYRLCGVSGFSSVYKAGLTEQ